jgi:hypothetical protein
VADTRIAKLRKAIKQSDELFERYEKDCRELIRNLRSRLVTFLEAPQTCVEWVSYAESDEMFQDRSYVDATADRRMILHDDAFYQFAFKLDLEPSIVVIHLRVKRLDDEFVVRVDKDDFKVSSSREETYDPLLAQIYETLMDHVERRFDRFIRGEPRRLGFVTP